MSECLCSCGTPIRDAVLCTPCAMRLDEAIALICGYQGLGHDLDVAVARLDRIEHPAGRPQIDDRDDIRQWPGTLKPTPIPYGEHAAQAAAGLRRALAAWADRIAVETGIKDWKPAPGGPFPICRRCEHPSCIINRPPVQPPVTIAGLAAWLRPRVGWLRHHHDGQRAYTEILDAVREAQRAVDRPAERLYAGPCDGDGCDEHLYARPGAASVECRSCGLVYDVHDRRRWLLEALDDHLVNATQMSRLVTYLGIELAPSSIRMYANKGRIAAHGRDADGHPLYRLGDVVRTYYAPRASGPKRSNRQETQTTTEPA